MSHIKDLQNALRNYIDSEFWTTLGFPSQAVSRTRNLV